MQWDLLKVGKCYVVVDGPGDMLMSGIPLKIIAKSLPFLLVEWQDDGTPGTLDTRCMNLVTVDKRYLTKFQDRKVARQEAPPANRCVNCGTNMVQSFKGGEWVFMCPQCGSLGGPVNA